MSSLESFAHRYAKATMLKWLREAAAEVGRDEYAEFCGISWRVNREGPWWGVWQEYPICQDLTGWGQVWDETEYCWYDDKPQKPPPSYERLLELGKPPLYILDLAIQHKGMISHAIEVVHKHPVSAEKVRFLESGHWWSAHVLEIPAAWILGQVEKPKTMPREFRLT